MTVTRQRTLIIYHIHANLYYIVLHTHTHNTDKQNMPEVFKMKKKQLAVESCTMVVFKTMHF